VEYEVVMPYIGGCLSVNAMETRLQSKSKERGN